MATGLQSIWPVCSREGSIWETKSYAERIRVVEFLAMTVVDVLTRVKEIVARTRSQHPEWIAPQVTADVQLSLEAARAVLARVTDLREWLNRPRPPVNEEMIRRSQESLNRGEGEAVSDLLARLTNGGPLVGE
jgi:hypothetical protein